MFNETTAQSAARIAGTPDGVEANRNQIERALELAEARRNAKNRVTTDQAVENYRRAREPQIPSPRTWLEMVLNEHLGRWDRVPQTMMSGRPYHEFFKPKAEASLQLIDGALERLGAKAGDRAESTRAWLTERRNSIAGALDHFTSLGALLDGPYAVDLISRISASRAALAKAYADKECASRATVEAAILEIERCLCDSREIDRDVAEAKTALLSLPELPAAADFAKAEGETLAVEELPKARPYARQMFQVLQAAFSTPATISRLHVVYETPGLDHALVQLRARAIVEGGS